MGRHRRPAPAGGRRGPHGGVPWSQGQAKAAGFKTVGIYAGALGIGYNEELLKEKGLPAPKCWADLTDPVYKGEIQIANPNSSGTAYTTLATIVQIFGENKAFEWLKGLHKNINQYTKSGSAPIKAAARGETTLAITFMHDMVTQVVEGFPIKIVAPCEGTGYEIGSMSIIKGARNMESAMPAPRRRRGRRTSTRSSSSTTTSRSTVRPTSARAC